MTVLALTGGVGGAKLALGLTRVLLPEDLVFLVNTGDDFTHLGLHISPDVDTLLYTLSELANRDQGWGRENESWNFMESLEALGGETWFQLGDRDLALHHYRTQQLAEGLTLSAVTSDIAQQLGIKFRVLPMSDESVRTEVDTTSGRLSFQHYFVREKCEPEVSAIRYSGAADASLNPHLLLNDIRAVVICPSNPYLSVDPMLAIPELRTFLASTDTPVVAVTPIVKGLALKGPTAKLMAELGVQATATNVAKHYKGLINGFVLDETDAELRDSIESLGVRVSLSQTIMRTMEDRVELARNVLQFTESLR